MDPIPNEQDPPTSGRRRRKANTDAEPAPATSNLAKPTKDPAKTEAEKRKAEAEKRIADGFKEADDDAEATQPETAAGTGADGDDPPPLKNIAVDPDELRDDLDSLHSLARSVSEAAGDLRARIKAILDQRGYHKTALGDIRKIDNMSPERRADYLRTFLPMLEILRPEWERQAHDLLGGLSPEGDE